MGASNVQTKSAIATSATSVAVSLTGVGAGNHLNATGWSSNGTLNAATSTPAATWSNAFNETTKFPMVRNDYSENVASGSWTVTINASAASTLFGEVAESSGVTTSVSLGATANNLQGGSGAATIQAGSITPSAGSVLYALAGTTNPPGGTSAATIDSSFTVDEAGGGLTVWSLGDFNMAGGTAHLNNAAGTAVNPTWTAGANWSAPATWGNAVIIEFKAAAAAAAQVPYQPWYQRAPFLAT